MATHTHPELIDPALRSVFANEILVFRKTMKKFYLSRRDPMTAGVFMGLETAFRRVQDVNKQGVETVYKQNYTQPRYTQTAQPSYQEVIRQFPRERKERE